MFKATKKSLTTGRQLTVRLYRIWQAMVRRCDNPKVHDYVWYGGRGIRVCDEWRSYPAFRAWAVANGYSKHGTIDRKDSDGHYEPANCRWIPGHQQNWTKRNTVWLTVGAETKPLPQWAAERGIALHTLMGRYRRGWSPAAIIDTLPRRGRRPKATVC